MKVKHILQVCFLCTHEDRDTYLFYTSYLIRTSVQTQEKLLYIERVTKVKQILQACVCVDTNTEKKI